MSNNKSSDSPPDLAREVLALKQALSDRTKELCEARKQSGRDALLAELGKVVSAAAHELRGPLGAMLTSLHLVESRVGAVDPAAKKGLERIRRSVRRCDDILTSLLDYSRYEPLAPEPTRIDQWLRDLLDARTLPEGVSLTFDPGLGDRRFSVGRDRLRQAIDHVIENAVQAIVDSGTPGRIVVNTLTDGARFTIRIADSGPGIPDSSGENIFKPFFSTRKSGIGLGLAIARRIVERHGGTLSFESGPNRQTCFIMTLPSQSDDMATD